MALVLNNTVHVENFDVPDGRGSFPPGTPKSEIPDWALVKIGDHCFEDDKDVPETAEAEEVSELESLKVDELRLLAEERGLDVPATAKKADLIQALSQ